MRTWLSRPPTPAGTDRFDRSARAADGIDGCSNCDDDGSTVDDPKLQVLIAIIENFTGRPVHVIDASELTGERHEGAAPVPRGRGWGRQIARRSRGRHRRIGWQWVDRAPVGR